MCCYYLSSSKQTDVQGELDDGTAIKLVSPAGTLTAARGIVSCALHDIWIFFHVRESPFSTTFLPFKAFTLALALGEEKAFFFFVILVKSEASYFITFF